MSDEKLNNHSNGETGSLPAQRLKANLESFIAANATSGDEQESVVEFYAPSKRRFPVEIGPIDAISLSLITQVPYKEGKLLTVSLDAFKDGSPYFFESDERVVEDQSRQQLQPSDNSYVLIVSDNSAPFLVHEQALIPEGIDENNVNAASDAVAHPNLDTLFAAAADPNSAVQEPYYLTDEDSAHIAELLEKPELSHDLLKAN